VPTGPSNLTPAAIFVKAQYPQSKNSHVVATPNVDRCERLHSQFYGIALKFENVPKYCAQVGKDAVGNCNEPLAFPDNGAGGGRPFFNELHLTVHSAVPAPFAAMTTIARLIAQSGVVPLA
jgi:hypothetical protein